MVDTDAQTLAVDVGSRSHTFNLYSADAFRVLSQLWIKAGWAVRYSYSFTWLGRPVIQLPEDLLRVQELVFRARPDLLIETGVAHGGSLLYYASLFRLMGTGRVLGIDIEIRPPNRQALSEGPMRDLITLLEGNSVDMETVAAVRSHVRPGEKVLVILDSNHTRDHVARELEAYSPLVTVGSYLVVTDGIMQELADVPGGRPEWREDNPQQATRAFLAGHPEFVLEEPAFTFNESAVKEHITYWPAAYLKRVA